MINKIKANRLVFTPQFNQEFFSQAKASEAAAV